ncbi:O-antigen ligase family protein [Daejeonella oryzae]|uniref:O-antigen ligase family protein n=1 Tax=Daejeonella oryzae TaxID=1122943 RepID=UPI000414A587|nr:O-antigen ligase family protein [Daejeonella oryzae]
MKKAYNILFGILIIFILYPNIERIVFINEIFVLMGLMLLVRNYKTYYKKTEIALNAILFYILYGLIYSLISFLFLKVSTNYEFIRTLPIWYSSFAFFLGIEFINRIDFKKWFGGLRANIFLIALTFIAPGRLTNQILLPISLVNSKTAKYFLLISTLFFVYKGGATSYVSLAVLLVVSIIKNKKFMRFLTSKFTITVILAGFTALVWYVQKTYGTFLVNSNYEVFQNIVDNNTIWRFMFWVYEFKINIYNNPIFGIGFGTPLFDLSRIPLFITSDDGSRMTPYTLGTHNSLIFILVRLGIVGLLPILILFGKLLKDYFWNKNFGLQNVCFNMFLFIGVAMLFNVIMESPVYGGIFWVVTGMFYQSLQIKKKIYAKRKNIMPSAHATTIARSELC